MAPARRAAALLLAAAGAAAAAAGNDTLIASTQMAQLAAADVAGCATPADPPRPSAAAAAPRPANASAARRCANSLAAGSHEEHVTAGGKRRSFRYYVPSGLSSSQEVPVLIFFHGYYGSGPAFERTTNAASYAQQHQWITLHPSGTGDYTPGWNAGACCGGNNEDDLAFVDAMLDWVEAAMCAGKKFAAGFSNGGFFSNRLGCERAAAFTGVAPLAGPLGFYPSPTGPDRHVFRAPCAPGAGRHPTVLHMHGTSDPTVPYNGDSRNNWPSATASAESWAAINGCSGSRTEGNSRVWTGCDGGSSVELVTYPNGGHTYFSDVTQRVFDKFLPLA